MADTQTKPAGKGANAAEFSVSELSGAIKRALEDGFGYIRLRGEISGYRGPHASGHCYFTLKDQRARIDAVIWRGVFSRLRIKPEEGMEVIATGKVSSYPGSSKYQIVVDGLEPAGLGAMMVELEERKKRLGAEGLFEDARKKSIPFLPATVGVITSPTGAVIRDILAGFTERFPTHVVVWPAKVQGEGSAADIARAIHGMNALGTQALGTQSVDLPKPDIIIVARGGGSLEDLWSFNDEAVVRAAAESTIPLIAAVGHETDWTLIDLVADARAPTPTKAAEWTVPKYADLIGDIADRHGRLRVAIRRRLEGERTHLKAAARGLPRLDDLVTLPRQRFDMLERRLAQALVANTQALHTRATRASSRLNPTNLRQRIAHAGQRSQTTAMRLDRALTSSIITHRRALTANGKLLHSLGYRNVLARGFAIVRNPDGAMVRQARPIAAGAHLDIEFVDGHVAATAGLQQPPGRDGPATAGSSPTEPTPTGQSTPTPPDTSIKSGKPAKKPSRTSKRSGGGGGQGSLF